MTDTHLVNLERDIIQSLNYQCQLLTTGSTSTARILTGFWPKCTYTPSNS